MVKGIDLQAENYILVIIHWFDNHRTFYFTSKQISSWLHTCKRSTIWLWGGNGWFGLGENLFSHTYIPVTFFSSIIHHERFFFQYRMFFPQVFPCKIFFHSISVCKIFFLKSPIPPSKVKWSDRPLISTAQGNQTLHVNLVYFNQQIGLFCWSKQKWRYSTNL